MWLARDVPPLFTIVILSRLEIGLLAQTAAQGVLSCVERGRWSMEKWNTGC